MMLRAEAPSFLMPPPGLGALCGMEVAEAAWLSPCSTAAPSPSFTAEPSPCFGATASPSLSGSLSPWAESFDPSRSRVVSEDVFLPETAFPCFYEDSAFSTTFADMIPHQEFQFTPPIRFESNVDEEFRFKLTGIEDLEISLASLFTNLTPTTDGGCSPLVLFPSTSDEETMALSPPPGLAPSELEEAAPVSELVQKKGWGPLPAADAPKETPHADEQQTSVMMQNVPKKCTRDMLATILSDAGFCGDFDFVYVMADLKQRNSGSGSALVNFRSDEAAVRFTAAFHKTAVAIAFAGFTGKKAVEVSQAATQGLIANVRKLEKSGVLMSMLSERPGWQPARYDSAGQVEAEIGGC